VKVLPAGWGEGSGFGGRGSFKASPAPPQSVANPQCPPRTRAAPTAPTPLPCVLLTWGLHVNVIEKNRLHIYGCLSIASSTLSLG